MARNGVMTCLYLQIELLPAIDKCISEHRDNYKSRNAFINGAVSRELRRLGYLPQEVNQE